MLAHALRIGVQMENKYDDEVLFWRMKIVEIILRITDVQRLRSIKTISQSIENSPLFEEDKQE